MNSIATLDIGGGTQDFLLYISKQYVYNAIKMVLSSPSQIVASQIRKALKERRNIFLYGWTMGGGAITLAVKECLEENLKVYATIDSALSLNDNLHYLKEMGIKIIDKEDEYNIDKSLEFRSIFTFDFDILKFRGVFDSFEIPQPDLWAIAVCDHGYSKEISNRKLRINIWKSFLNKGGNLLDLITKNPDFRFTRMRAVLKQCPNAFVMDTAAAALWGALEDPLVLESSLKRGVCVVNMGNMHIVAFLIKDYKIFGVYEHHTNCLDLLGLQDQIVRFINNDISNDEVFENMGHGCIYSPDYFRGNFSIAVTGPKRYLAEKLGWKTAIPYGDVMLSGAFGLLAATKLKMEGKKLI